MHISLIDHDGGDHPISSSNKSYELSSATLPLLPNPLVPRPELPLPLLQAASSLRPSVAVQLQNSRTDLPAKHHLIPSNNEFYNPPSATLTPSPNLLAPRPELPLRLLQQEPPCNPSIAVHPSLPPPPSNLAAVLLAIHPNAAASLLLAACAPDLESPAALPADALAVPTGRHLTLGVSRLITGGTLTLRASGTLY